MRKTEAMNLHNEDEVIVKKTGCVMTVLDVDIFVKDNGDIEKVDLLLDDGNWYGHKEVM